MTPEVRRTTLQSARDLFNAGEYWLAHEALETVWRSIIGDGDEAAARVWQGLIQAAAALLHQERGNRHGVGRRSRSWRARSGPMSKSRRFGFASSWRERSPAMPSRRDWSCGLRTKN